MTHKPTPEEIEALALLRKLEREWARLHAQYKKEDAQQLKKEPNNVRSR